MEDQALKRGGVGWIEAQQQTLRAAGSESDEPAWSRYTAAKGSSDSDVPGDAGGELCGFLGWRTTARTDMCSCVLCRKRCGLGTGLESVWD
jgi:hypothetical protein